MLNEPVSEIFHAESRLELLMECGIDGVLGESWEDENGAIIATGFFTYLIGEPTTGEETDCILRRACPYCVIPKSRKWLEYLKRFEYRTYTRYKMAPPAQFDTEKLKKLADLLPEVMDIRPVDREMLRERIVTEQELNIPHAFGNRENYLRDGFGFAVLEGTRAVSVVSSYIVHKGEAEVDISTDKEYRRRGLASAVCARFLLECISRGITPSWDAQNAESVKLAEKLGFTLDHAYDACVLAR